MRALLALLLAAGCALPRRHGASPADFDAPPADAGLQSIDPPAITGDPDLSALLAALMAGAPQPRVAASAKPIMVVLSGPIDAASVASAIAELDASEKAGASESYVLIDSSGGSLYAGFDLAHSIERRKMRVTCIVDGQALSMALELLQSCDHRVMTRRSVLMAHRVSVSPDSATAVDIANLTDEIAVRDEAVLQQYARRSRVPIEEWRKRTDNAREWWFDWRAAQAAGLVDEVVAKAGDAISAP